MENDKSLKFSFLYTTAMDGPFFFKGKSVIAGGDEEGLMEKFFPLIQKHIKLPPGQLPKNQTRAGPNKTQNFSKTDIFFPFPNIFSATKQNIHKLKLNRENQ
jgi:hypothetical protein